MKKNNLNISSLITRYILLLLFGMFNLSIFYFIFTPLTVYPVYWLVSLVDPSAKLLIGNVLFFSGNYAEIISACVAGSAYYLLLILNLSTRMNIRERLSSLVFLFGAFLLVNISRIIVFLALFFLGFQYFDISHLLTWYFGSTMLVIILWFVNVWLLKIDSIPVYSDIQELYKVIKGRS